MSKPAPLPCPDLPRLPLRDRAGHKGDYGRALLIGGSRGMSGAIALAGMSALRGGAGLVTLAVPDSCLDVVASIEPSYMTIPLACDDQGRIVATAWETIGDAAENANCVAIGPGIGRSPALVELLAWAYETLPHTLVIDADGLNALAQHTGGLENPGGPRILTPHLGEYRRLADRSELTLDEAADSARDLAVRQGLVVVLKGHATLVTDGAQDYHNTTGNPGMATGGSGDVLTGIITALVCQGLAPFAAAQLGVYVHGLAGDQAADELGEVSLTAGDLVRFLPAALKTVYGVKAAAAE
jgi:ADP-dependent NAD(P)H-hydrate dehydratase